MKKSLWVNLPLSMLLVVLIKSKKTKPFLNVKMFYRPFSSFFNGF